MILAIDTSLRRRVVVAIAGRDGVAADSVCLDDVAVAPALGTALQRLLSDELDAVVVATGPGSYTGVRTGMAAALGVAHARGLPLYGIGSLDIVAHGAPLTAQRIRAVSDASRGGIFVAGFVRVPGVHIRRETDARRIELNALNGGDVDAVVSTDVAVSGDGILVADAILALAAAAASAVLGRPLDTAELTAEYVARPRFTLTG